MHIPAEIPHLPERFEQAIARIGAGAAERERPPVPSFPADAFESLAAVGALAWNAVVGKRRPPASEELRLVRSVACADGSVGRLLDGHLNAVERLAVQAPAQLRAAEWNSIVSGQLWAGVWGGDPRPGEGPPAAIVTTPGGDVLRGVKTFCSGAGGLHRALVLARNAEGTPPSAVWIDLTDTDRVEVDETWFRSYGLRASASHRVVFHDAPVIAHFGGPGSLVEQPWFARDALRTAASWVGMADRAVEAALTELAARPSRGQLEELSAGKLLTARASLDLWIGEAARAMDSGEGLAEVSIHARAAIAGLCAELLDTAARACGSHPFVQAAALDRARRDLQVFLLQHRLDPLIARVGAAELEERS
jgi:alkylation response protein AidB-like acyl-CoA dehydrogenase